MYQRIVNNHGWSKHVSRNERYGMYYKSLMDEMNFQKWANSQKRLGLLRKELRKLGNVPNRPAQRISTLHFLVAFVNAVTKFYDAGPIDGSPENQSDTCKEFNKSIELITRRQNTPISYSNRSEPGQEVTANNLFIGIATPISSAENSDSGKNFPTETFQEKNYKIIVRMQPVSMWINSKIFTTTGEKASISQKDLAFMITTLLDNLLASIDTLLK